MMFEKATQRLVHQVDYDGALIAVSRVNDSRKLKPLAVVIKHPKKWLWQRSKYRPTDFTLNDLLQDQPIQPVLEETDFLRYKERREGNIGGSMEVKVDGASVFAEGNNKSKLCSSLGMLRKETVNMQQLLRDSTDRKVDLQHRLIQQTSGKSKRAFTLVVERIFTSCDCTIEYSDLQGGNCTSILNMLGFWPSKVLLRESSMVQYDTSVDIDLPPNTVIAYSVVDLNIKNNGECELAACCDGFEADDDSTPLTDESEVDGAWLLAELREGSLLSSLKKVLEDVKASFCILSHLSAQTRSSLLSQFQKIMVKRINLSALEDKLEELCGGAVYSSQTTSDTYISNPTVDTFLKLLQSEANYRLTPKHSNQKGSGQTGATAACCTVMPPMPACMNGSTMKTQSVLPAMHMLVSAAEGLTDVGLSLLQGLCSKNMLKGLNDLVNLLTDEQEPLSDSNLPTALRDKDTLHKVEQLFNSSNILLKGEAEYLRARAGSGDELLPLVLCVVIHGLSYLNEG